MRATVKLVARIDRNRIEARLMFKMIQRPYHGTITPTEPLVWH